MTMLTERQESFLKRLMDERLDPDDPGDLQWRDEVAGRLDSPLSISKRDASQAIDFLLGRKPVTKVADVTITENIRTVPDGTYTLVDEDGHITIRVRSAEWAKDLPPGSQVAEFLSGSDNESDFTGFGFVVKSRPRVWRRFDKEGRPARALQALLALDDQEVRDAGFKYALESSRCYRCNRKLTVPASIHRGLGPVCAGVMEGESD